MIALCRAAIIGDPQLSQSIESMCSCCDTVGSYSSTESCGCRLNYSSYELKYLCTSPTGSRGALSSFVLTFPRAAISRREARHLLVPVITFCLHCTHQLKVYFAYRSVPRAAELFARCLGGSWLVGAKLARVDADPRNNPAHILPLYSDHFNPLTSAAK